MPRHCPFYITRAKITDHINSHAIKQLILCLIPSKYKQVICITHLPQIAISADYHLHVTKSVINSNSTSVKAEYLNGDLSKSVIKNLFVGEEVRT